MDVWNENAMAGGNKREASRKLALAKMKQRRKDAALRRKQKRGGTTLALKSKPIKPKKTGTRGKLQTQERTTIY